MGSRAASVASNACRQLAAETNVDPLTLSPNCTTVMEMSGENRMTTKRITNSFHDNAVLISIFAAKWFALYSIYINLCSLRFIVNTLSHIQVIFTPLINIAFFLSLVRLFVFIWINRIFKYLNISKPGPWHLIKRHITACDCIHSKNKIANWERKEVRIKSNVLIAANCNELCLKMFFATVAENNNKPTVFLSKTIVMTKRNNGNATRRNKELLFIAEKRLMAKCHAADADSFQIAWRQWNGNWLLTLPSVSNFP